MKSNSGGDKEFYIANLLSVETFEGALKFCKDEGGILFEPRDTSITEILYSLMQAKGINNFWIGIHDKVNEGHFVYASNKSPIEWNKWSKGQPNSYGGDQDCVIVRYEDYYCRNHNKSTEHLNTIYDFRCTAQQYNPIFWTE